MIIIFFLFLKLIRSANWERQIARNGKLNIHFKNNFDLLVMNVTQLNFLNWQKFLQITTIKYKLKMQKFI